MSEAQETTDGMPETGGLFAAKPGVIPFAELSRLMVVGIDLDSHDRLVWKAQTTMNGPWEPKWQTINDRGYSVMCTGVTEGGYVAVVAQTRDGGEVHYIDEAADEPGNRTRWNAPVKLGLPKKVTAFMQLAMGRNVDGRIEIFGVDKSTGDLWWIYQNPPKTVEKTIEVVPPGQTKPVIFTAMETEPPDRPWSGWVRIPGRKVAHISVTNDADSRIILIAACEGPSRYSVYRNQQGERLTLTPDQWSGWIRMDDEASGLALSMPCAVLDTQDRLNVFMIGYCSQVVQIRQDKPCSETWSQWVRPGMLEQPPAGLVAGIDGDGHINLVAIDHNGAVHSTLQASVAEQQWSGWQQIAEAPGGGEMDLDYNADGRLTVFLRHMRTNGLSCISQFVLNSTSWDAAWTPLAGKGLGAFGVVRDLTVPAGE